MGTAGTAATGALVQQMHAYFSAEKAESLLFLALGAAALTFALQGIRKGPAFVRGMAWPLGLIALIQLVVGGTVFFRTEAQLSFLLGELAREQQQLLTAELTRMAVVNYWFSVYFWIEVSLIALGCAALGLGHRQSRRFLLGLGAGLVLQSSVMLALDLPAEARALRYTKELQKVREAPP